MPLMFVFATAIQAAAPSARTDPQPPAEESRPATEDRSPAPSESPTESEDLPARKPEAIDLPELGKKALRILIVQTQHRNFEMRLEAASAWGEIGNPAAVAILSRLLQDPNPYVRIEAAYSLKLLDSDLGMPVLESLMTVSQAPATELSTSASTRPIPSPTLADKAAHSGRGAATSAEHRRARPAQEVRSGRGAAPKDPIAEMQRIAQSKVRARAVDRLSRLGGARAVELLEKALKDPSGTVRDAAAIGLARLGFDEFTLHFIEALEKNDPRGRAEAARSLAAIGRPLHLKYLIKAYKKAPDYVRAEIIGALGNFPDAGLVGVLKKAADDPSPIIRAQAVSALVRLPEPATRKILKALVKKNEVPAITLKAMAGLAAKGEEVDLQMIRRVLWQKDPDVKLDAIAALQSARQPQAIALLESAMEDDKDDRVRIRAAKALIVKSQKRGKR